MRLQTLLAIFFAVCNVIVAAFSLKSVWYSIASVIQGVLVAYTTECLAKGPCSAFSFVAAMAPLVISLIFYIEAYNNTGSSGSSTAAIPMEPKPLQPTVEAQAPAASPPAPPTQLATAATQAAVQAVTSMPPSSTVAQGAVAAAMGATADTKEHFWRRGGRHRATY
jgi:cell division septation protein DedD